LGSTPIVVGTFLLVAAFEIARPWRPAKTFAAMRWVSNIALLLLTWGLDFLLAPVLAILAAAGSESDLPFWAQLAVGVPALDAAMPTLSWTSRQPFGTTPGNRYCWHWPSLLSAPRLACRLW
jgi:hypothetical protein